MSACGSLLDLEFEPSSGPGTPQATQSAPASIREFDLPSKYLKPTRPSVRRRSSDGDRPRDFDSSASQLYTSSLAACSRITLGTTDIPHPTTVVSEGCLTLTLPDSMAASFVEFEREDGLPQYTPPPATPSEEVHIDLNGALSTSSEKRNERLIWALNRQLAMQDKCPSKTLLHIQMGFAYILIETGAPYPSVEDEPLNTEPASYSQMVNAREILSIPETPLEFSKLRFGSQMSFNTSVRDLYQESPDVPIGTKVLAQKSYITSASKGPLGAVTNFTGQLPSSLKRWRKSPGSKVLSNSEASSSMTASAAYAKKRAGLATDLSYDGPAGDLPESGTSVRDFAFNPARRFLLQDAPISPLSSIPVEDMAAHNTRNAINGLDGFFSERRAEVDNNQSTSAQQSQVQTLTNMEQLSAGILPIDTTDVNSAPSIPQQGKRKSLRHLPRRVRRRALGGPIRGDDNTAPLHRRIRGKILVTPVLSAVVGRQLAKPTRNLLKELAKTAKAVPLPEGFAAAAAPL